MCLLEKVRCTANSGYKSSLGFYTKSDFRYEVLNDSIVSVFTALGLDTSNRWIGSIQFLSMINKDYSLLCFLIYIISYIQSYFPPERSKKILDVSMVLEQIL